MGISDLEFIVTELNKYCPWTRSQSAKKLCKFTIDEVNEIIEELDIMQNDDQSENSLKDLESEIGDLFFDALMVVNVFSFPFFKLFLFINFFFHFFFTIFFFKEGKIFIDYIKNQRCKSLL